MTATLHVEDREDGVRVLTLEHPARRNALNDELLALLDAALDAPPSVRAFLVRGAGGAFCSGYDLTHLGPPVDGRLPRSYFGRSHTVMLGGSLSPSSKP